GLLDDVELREADRWLAGPDAAEVGYGDALRHLVDASRDAIARADLAREAARQRELDQARALAAGAVRLTRRAQYLAVALVATLVAIAIAGWYWYSATAAEERAFAQYLVAKGQTLYDDKPLLGLRLAIEGLSRLPQHDFVYTDVMSTTVELIQRGR